MINVTFNYHYLYVLQKSKNISSYKLSRTLYLTNILLNIENPILHNAVKIYFSSIFHNRNIDDISWNLSEENQTSDEVNVMMSRYDTHRHRLGSF